ncbi:hypothetical protein GJ633_11490 [Halorubrum sp. CBA1125]|uniref:hypothetical protein n=1 Tax=Halorubrum sp. CBA1125 TaxID=2668072 RepID=UPI0012E81F0C|nr:hypothetical protein [Halorubrum sp. CBA1125]MUW15205.1 hypothetical protein [Halorubrum sp. CBA1125]
MIALIDFFARIVGDVGRFLDILVNNLLLGAGDPLSAVLVVAGQILILASVLALGYPVLGALLDEIGVTLPSLGGRGPVEE